jgi:hypothetical protein
MSKIQDELDKVRAREGFTVRPQYCPSCGEFTSELWEDPYCSKTCREMAAIPIAAPPASLPNTAEPKKFDAGKAPVVAVPEMASALPIATPPEERAGGVISYSPRSMEYMDGIATTPEAPKKFDVGKARHDLIPPCVPRLLAEVLEFGSRKYGANNWAKGEGLAWTRLYAALQRHLTAWWEGREQVDPETGKSHLAHALCQLAFLVASEEYGIGTDDRFKWNS